MPVEHPRVDWPNDLSFEPQCTLEDFRSFVWGKGIELYRDLPWRRTRDPYAIWLSEVMLQQTQVTRVDGRWQRWLERFPTVEALATAPQGDVLEEWQGMGYNRRALSLHRAARAIVEGGTGFPHDEAALLALPGVGPATAAGVRAFAFDLPGVYLETNVRTVFLHELFPNYDGVADNQLIPYVRCACPQDAPRSWYYALLDYGVWLKRTVPNPSRRSRAHTKQKRFEGSHRQKRGEVIRILLAAHGNGVTEQLVTERLCAFERAANREDVTQEDVRALLVELAQEGFCINRDGMWYT